MATASPPAIVTEPVVEFDASNVPGIAKTELAPVPPIVRSVVAPAKAVRVVAVVVKDALLSAVAPVTVRVVLAVMAFAASVVFATVSVPVAAPMLSVVAAPKALIVVLTVL